jgi:hypothetical protein
MTYVITPKRDILILGLRLDQIYTSAKASEEAINGISRKGVIAYSSAYPSSLKIGRTRRNEALRNNNQI